MDDYTYNKILDAFYASAEKLKRSMYTPVGVFATTDTEYVNIAFEIPLTDLPKHINHENEIIRAIVKQRLARGI